MKLPNQNPGVDRSNRLAAAQAAGVNPAFLGALASALPTILPILGKAGMGALQGVMNG